MKAIRTLLACIRKADQTYNLIQHGDKIVIGLSGGKDSIALTYCLSLYKRFSHTDFEIQPVVLDLGFPGFNPQPLIDFCETLGLKLIVSDNTDVYKILTIQKEKQNSAHLPCSICSRMKKAAINKVTKDIGFNKVAFAYHADDAIETLFMNEIFGGRVATFSPKMHLERADIEFIRPLCLVREKDIVRLVKEENLPVFPSHCPADKETTRENIKQMLAGIYKTFPNAYENYLRMLDNPTHLDTWSKDVSLQVNQCGLNLTPVTTPLQKTIVDDIRNKVFIIGQKVPYEEEYFLNEEAEAKHYLIKLFDEPIGTIRYLRKENEILIQRFAILDKYQRKGYGSQTLKYFVEMLTKEFTPVKLVLHAQYHLLNFYKNCGFNEVGEPFMEANIKHIKMEKDV